MKVGQPSRTIKEGHLPWSDFMVLSVKRPLLNRSKNTSCLRHPCRVALIATMMSFSLCTRMKHLSFTSTISWHQISLLLTPREVTKIGIYNTWMGDFLAFDVWCILAYGPPIHSWGIRIKRIKCIVHFEKV